MQDTKIQNRGAFLTVLSSKDCSTFSLPVPAAKGASTLSPSTRPSDLQDQALAAASPSIHSLGGSVSSAAAAQFSKAAGTPADFHSAGPAQPPRQTFAPGFPPPAQQHPQHAQQVCLPACSTPIKSLI